MKDSFRSFLIFAAGLTGVLALQHVYLSRAHPLEGAPAPTFEAMRLDGETFSLASHLGKDVVLLDFWAIWCPPCRESLPAVAALGEAYADRGVAVYAVNQGDTPERITGFLEDMGIAPSVLLDPAGAVAERYGVTGIPHLVIIGTDGIVDTVHVGASAGLEDELRTRLDALLEARGGDGDN